MHNNLNNQANLFTRGSQWHLQDRSHPLIPSTSTSTTNPNSSSAFYSKLLGCTSPPPQTTHLHGFLGEDPVVSNVVPSVTVVLEGRSICHRINLHKHASYGSLARALRQMFGNFGGAHDNVVNTSVGPTIGGGGEEEERVELGNAVPGHLVAYEDVENDLLLAGDLSWNDFVRVAKRIRILPEKPKSKRARTTGVKQATT